MNIIKSKLYKLYFIKREEIHLGRKVQITREQILEAGLQIVIRDGHAAISIKSVAAELGTSTTPITWTFDNLENYRKALRQYAMDYMNRKMLGDGQDTARDHRKTGDIYVDMAIDEPNLIRYLRSDESDLQSSGGIGFIFDEEKNAQARQGWARAIGVTEQQAMAFMQFVTTYTEGVVSLILSGVIHPTKEEAHAMLEQAGAAYTVFLKSGGRP